jgi:Uncharacterized conserved protein
MLYFTLTTDFGADSQQVAIVKAKILRQFSNCHIIDISHNNTPFNIQDVLYKFSDAVWHFPPDTFHFLLNDLYASSSRKLLYLYENKQHLFFPDNGFVTLFMHVKPFQVFEILDKPPAYNYQHITEIFLQTATSLLQGANDLVAPVDINQLSIIKPLINATDNQSIDAQPIHIDAFGNAVLNITREQFESARKGRSFQIHLPGNLIITKIHQHYNDVEKHEALCIFNSSDYLEIAINRGSASQLLGLRNIPTQSLRGHTIKIFFE